MSLRLYMDVHVHRSITLSLRGRGLDVLTAQEDGCETLDDPDLLDRATSLDRVLVTYDSDYFAIASTRQAEGVDFSGIIRVHLIGESTSVILDDLQLIAESVPADDIRNTVYFVPI